MKTFISNKALSVSSITRISAIRSFIGKTKFYGFEISLSWQPFTDIVWVTTWHAGKLCTLFFFFLRSFISSSNEFFTPSNAFRYEFQMLKPPSTSNIDNLFIYLLAVGDLEWMIISFIHILFKIPKMNAEVTLRPRNTAGEIYLCHFPSIENFIIKFKS